MNKVELMGRLTKDVNILKTKNDKEMATFTLAVPRKGQKDTTDFIDCVAFGELPSILSKYTSKGVRLIVTGAINISDYKEGNTKKSFSILVDDFYFVDFKKEND